MNEKLRLSCTKLWFSVETEENGYVRDWVKDKQVHRGASLRKKEAYLERKKNNCNVFTPHFK